MSHRRPLTCLRPSPAISPSPPRSVRRGLTWGPVHPGGSRVGGSARGHNPGAAGTQQREPRRGLRRPPRAVRAEMPGSPSPLPCLDGQPRNAVSTRIAEPCGPTCRPRLSPTPRFLTHPSIQVPPETKTRWQGDRAEMTKRGVACIFGKPHRENLTITPTPSPHLCQQFI